MTKTGEASGSAPRNSIWSYVLKHKSKPFCTFRDVASAGPPKDPLNDSQEHRFCTSHAKEARCETIAPDCRLRGLLEAPRRRRRGKCKTAHFYALKRNSKWIFAVHSLRTDTEFSVSVLAQWRIYIYIWTAKRDTQKTETQESSATKIPFGLTFLALKRLSDRTFRDGAPAGPPFDPENV